MDWLIALDISITSRIEHAKPNWPHRLILAGVHSVHMQCSINVGTNSWKKIIVLRCALRRCIDSATNFPVQFLQRVLPDIRRRGDGKDAFSGRGDPVDDVWWRSTRSRRADLRACQSGKQLRRDARQRRRIPLRRTHQLPVLRESGHADKFDASTGWQQSSITRPQRYREIGFLLHAIVRSSSRHRHRQRRLAAEIHPSCRRPSSGNGLHGPK